MNVAENSLMTHLMKEQVDAILSRHKVPEWVFHYTDPSGNPEVRAVIARFLEQYLCGCPIEPDAIGFSAGASAIIEVSAFLLGDKGDVVVIPAPSYPMYTNDMGVKSGLVRYDLQTHYHLAEHGADGPVKKDMLENVWDELNAQEKNFKLLVITSPDNPTGVVYSEQRLRELAGWCIQHKVHMVVNEIYGLSRINTEGGKVQKEDREEVRHASFAKIMAEYRSDYLHLWYALSKDFASSGMRFGIVHSLNKDFLEGFANVNVPHMVSNLTQWIMGELFRNTAFIESYLEENRKRLTGSYEVVVAALNRIGVPYIPASGSLFVWADFSQYLKETSGQEEEKLWLNIYRNTGVLLTPGSGFRHQKKGLFRIVHTAVPTAHLKVAMDRMTAYLSAL
ncbi:pyridoxal phosphate-dependent aminotransferase [Nafulsella turpanensis]|uniref:pyridoxal phosphate-dependent aminotransferase n=1 Tax=Nafulsella turpanensis TaxID=1265690 RepID=UPI00191BF3BE|nr:pyridoxal phosphate-dependent aminotransferase [Nafulsella turpanensis]